MASGWFETAAMSEPEALNQVDAMHNSGASLFARLRAWFEARQQSCKASGRTPPVDHDRAQVTAPTPGGQLLSFPIRSEAVLVRLADHLRRRIGNRRWTRDPLFLLLSRHPRPRLTIDRDTYVEFDPGCGGYRAVLEAGSGTRFTIETSDFDTVVSFVAQYVADRLSDPDSLEAAL